MGRSNTNFLDNSLQWSDSITFGIELQACFQSQKKYKKERKNLNSKSRGNHENRSFTCLKQIKIFFECLNCFYFVPWTTS